MPTDYEKDLEKRNQELEEIISKLYDDIESADCIIKGRGEVVSSLVNIIQTVERDSKLNNNMLRESVAEMIRDYKRIVKVGKDNNSVTIFNNHFNGEDDVIREWKWEDQVDCYEYDDDDYY